ncbi:MAG: hypothetical protein FJW63_10355 [Actinobacteria bacterium]|nr:hypothetical protein [Actinomycetota bacterium]
MIDGKTKIIIKNISKFGKNYQEEYLFKDCKKDLLKNYLKSDWFVSLKFFFDRAFMRGRRDELSVIFEDRAIVVIDYLFRKNIKIIKNLNDDFFDMLNQRLLDEGVNNINDREMVAGIIRFMAVNISEDFNIINYTIKNIENKNLQKVYSDLMKVKHIGHKIASFYLRDFVCVFDEYKFNAHEQTYFQPIDSWVGKILSRLKFLDELGIKKTDNLNERQLYLLRQTIVNKCLESAVSPIEFNQGAWYIGKNSYDILLKNLDKI